MKRFIIPAAIAVLMGVGGYLGYRSHAQSTNSTSDLLLANAEALADNTEAGGFEYPTGYPYSTKCNVTTGSNFWGATHCKVEVIVCQGGGAGCNSKKCPAHPA